jgi:predicted ABC-type ATPase
MNEEQKPRLIIVAGPNGSGKTTITEKLLYHTWMQGCEYINPDLIANSIYGDWNSQESVLKAANHASLLREELLKNHRSIAFETVFSTQEKLDFIVRAKEAGYFVRLFFVCLNDPTINAQRVAMRVMEGGHDVPISKIISRYYRSITNCVKALEYVDRAYFYDNSATDTDPKLMFRVSDSKIVKTYLKPTSWAQPVYELLKRS